MNILISTASRNVSYINRFKKALDKEGGGKIISIDSSPYAVGLRYSDVSYIVPKSTEPDFIDTVIKICTENNVKLIIPNRDEELPLYSRNKQRFLKLGITIMVADYPTILTCQNKKIFNKFCIDNNYNIPKTYNDSDIKNKHVKFPLFIKESVGKSSKKIIEVTNYDELRLAMAMFNDPIVQEFVEMDEYSIDLFSNFNGEIITVVPRKRMSVFGGECFIGKIERNNLIESECKKLAKSLGLVGHNVIQCFSDGNIVKFIEVNPRFGGASILSIEAGADTPLYLVRIMNNKKIGENLKNINDDLVMMRYIEDVFINNKDIMNGIEKND